MYLQLIPWLSTVDFSPGDYHCHALGLSQVRGGTKMGVPHLYTIEMMDFPINHAASLGYLGIPCRKPRGRGLSCLNSDRLQRRPGHSFRKRLRKGLPRHKGPEYVNDPYPQASAPAQLVMSLSCLNLYII